MIPPGHPYWLDACDRDGCACACHLGDLAALRADAERWRAIVGHVERATEADAQYTDAPISIIDVIESAPTSIEARRMALDLYLALVELHEAALKAAKGGV